MDPWDAIRSAAADRRSGSLAVAARAAAGLADLRARRDVLRASRALLRAHPAMALLWRALAVSLEGEDPRAFVARASADTEAAADAIRWVPRGRRLDVVTHSASSAVEHAIGRLGGRVARVVCGVSLPGAEGRSLARRLAKRGIAAEVIADAELGRACERADLALCGLDMLTEHGVVNKVGTRLLALAARDSGTACYAIGSSQKLLPHDLWLRARERAPLYEATPLELFDAVITERGAQRPGQIRRGVARVRVPAELARALG